MSKKLVFSIAAIIFAMIAVKFFVNKDLVGGIINIAVVAFCAYIAFFTEETCKLRLNRTK